MSTNKPSTSFGRFPSLEPIQPYLNTDTNTGKRERDEDGDGDCNKETNDVCPTTPKRPKIAIKCPDAPIRPTAIRTPSFFAQVKNSNSVISLEKHMQNMADVFPTHQAQETQETKVHPQIESLGQTYAQESVQLPLRINIPPPNSRVYLTNTPPPPPPSTKRNFIH